MIRSMTGFGSAVASNAAGEFSAEVKSLNNRFLDLSVKTPRELNFMELPLRDEVKKRVRRGKVDLYLRWTPAPDAQPLYEINHAMLRTYAGQAREAITGLSTGETLDLGSLLQLPGVVNPTHAATEDGALAAGAISAVRQALDALDKSRSAEGAALVAAISGHLEVLATIRTETIPAKEEILEEHKARLRERVATLEKSLDTKLDPARLEIEIVMFADKSDITEELVRLESHITAFRKLLASKTGEPVGKPMDFLVQELLREATTIGNKARGASISSLMVGMKSEIEKIREQALNIE